MGMSAEPIQLGQSLSAEPKSSEVNMEVKQPRGAFDPGALAWLLTGRCTLRILRENDHPKLLLFFFLLLFRAD